MKRDIQRILTTCENWRSLPDICAGVPLGGDTRACTHRVETLETVGLLESRYRSYLDARPSEYRTTATGVAWLRRNDSRFANSEKEGGASREPGSR